MSSNRHAVRDTDEEIAKREKELLKQRQKEQQLRNDRIKLLQTPEFQRVMADILAKGGMFQSVMTGNSWSYHKSGRQDFAREIWADMASVNQELAFELLKPKFGDDFEGKK